MNADTETLLISYLYGELSEDATASFEARLDEDGDLRAELEGMQASLSLIEDDDAFGTLSGLDMPPSHLQSAIFAQEALERPAEIRQAALQIRAPMLHEPIPLVQRLSTWIFGGGTLALGAAAVFIFTSNMAEDQAPTLSEAMDKAAVMPAAIATSDPKSAAAGGEGAFKQDVSAKGIGARAPDADDSVFDALDAKKQAGDGAGYGLGAENRPRPVEKPSPKPTRRTDAPAAPEATEGALSRATLKDAERRQGTMIPPPPADVGSSRGTGRTQRKSKKARFPIRVFLSSSTKSARKQAQNKLLLANSQTHLWIAYHLVQLASSPHWLIIL